MIFGIYVNLTVYSVKKRGDKCQVSDDNVTWSFIMYASYFVLFFHFFYKAYISPKAVKNQPNGKAALLADEKPKANGSPANHHDSNNNSIDTKSAKKRLNGNANKKVD